MFHETLSNEGDKNFAARLDNGFSNIGTFVNETVEVIHVGC